MARPWRIEFPEAVYHVTARGNNRAAIVLDDSDRRKGVRSQHITFDLTSCADCYKV